MYVIQQQIICNHHSGHRLDNRYGTGQYARVMPTAGLKLHGISTDINR